MNISLKQYQSVVLLLTLSLTLNVQAEINFGGRIQVDFDDTEVNGISESETEFRRVWVNFSGKSENWKYVARFDVRADEFNDDAIVDLNATYSGFGNGMKLTLGRHKTQFGMNWITSNAKLNIAERGGVVELHSFGRMEGAMLSGSLNQSINYWIGLYDKEDFDGTATIGRLTYSASENQKKYYHLGAGFALSQNKDNFNLEFAFGNGPFNIQTEYFNSAAGNALQNDTDGFYVEAGYFLNGNNSRPYKNGVFGGVNPKSEYGDWQLVARYESGDGNYSDIGLGRTEATAWVIGLNWYVTPCTSFYASYMTGNAEHTSDKGNEFRIRGQYVF